MHGKCILLRCHPHHKNGHNKKCLLHIKKVNSSMLAFMGQRVNFCSCAFEKMWEPTTAEKGYREVQSVCERKGLVGLFFWRDSPPGGQGLLIHEVSRTHTATHYSRLDFSGRAIGPSQRPVPENTQHSQRTNVHAPRWDSIPQSQQASGHRERGKS